MHLTSCDFLTFSSFPPALFHAMPFRFQIPTIAHILGALWLRWHYWRGHLLCRLRIDRFRRFFSVARLGPRPLNLAGNFFARHRCWSASSYNSNNNSRFYIQLAQQGPVYNSAVNGELPTSIKDQMKVYEASTRLKTL